RRRPQALARPEGGSRAHRPARDRGDVRAGGRCAAAQRARLQAQQLQDRSRAPLHRARADPSRARHAAVAVFEKDRVSTAMPYIGTSQSRIDGVAKVTGAAKYAAEFNAPGLLHGSIVAATIAKGRITRIDTSDAKRVAGVIDVITHENRPPMADNDQAYKDELAPLGSPFRALYDDRILFDGQPIALVVAETSEIARFAGSLVQVEYAKEAHVTDLFRLRDAAVPIPAPTNPFEALFTPPEPRGTPEQALAAAAVRHEGEYYVPIENHNPMELFAATV